MSLPRFEVSFGCPRQAETIGGRRSGTAAFSGTILGDYTRPCDCPTNHGGDFAAQTVTHWLDSRQAAESSENDAWHKAITADSLKDPRAALASASTITQFLDSKRFGHDALRIGAVLLERCPMDVEDASVTEQPIYRDDSVADIRNPYVGWRNYCPDWRNYRLRPPRASMSWQPDIVRPLQADLRNWADRSYKLADMEILSRLIDQDFYTKPKVG